MNIESIDKTKLATSGEEYRALVGSDADWIARSADDVWQVREAGHGPFVKMPEADLRAFMASLQFESGGLSTGSYRPLMASLTLTDIFEVFERFGMSRGYFLETHEAKCEGSTCSFDFWSFCSSVCGSSVKEE